MVVIPGHYEAFWKELDGVMQTWKNMKELKVLFSIPTQFPRHQPVLTLQSCQQICYRDLKLENIVLLDGSTSPRLKICDFGYSKSSVLHSQPKSTVGTPTYIAPEVLSRKEYDRKIADVWSCGVTLYVMLVGAYPFEDPDNPRNFKKTIRRILSVQYSIPDYVRVSTECRHLLSWNFVANPKKRITIPEIKTHPWFLRNLPIEMTEGYQSSMQDDTSSPLQNHEGYRRGLI